MYYFDRYNNSMGLFSNPSILYNIVSTLIVVIVCIANAFFNDFRE